MENNQELLDIETLEPKKKRSASKAKDVIMYVLIVVLIAAIGFLYWKYTDQQKDAEEMRISLETQKSKLTEQLNELYAQYDSLKTDNDSLNSEFQQQQQKITDLLSVRASLAQKIHIYETELVTLRKVMRSYISQIDSLNTLNKQLVAENLEVRSEIRKTQDQKEVIQKEKEELQGKVDQASVLKALNIQAQPIRSNGRISTKIKKTDKIRVCFALSENPIAPKGVKEVFIRIARPDEMVMAKSTANLFAYNEDQIVFSAKREVQYDGLQLDVCIYYDCSEEELIEGTYYVDLFTDGAKIGTSSFTLK